MERSRVALVTFMCVWISSVSGTVVEMRVSPGDNVTLYCDCAQKGGNKSTWILKPLYEHQPPLIRLTENSTPPRYSLMWNNSRITYDLLVKNITESDLGLYYCALHQIKHSRKEYGSRVREDVYHDGDRYTFLSFLDSTVPCTDPPWTPSTPPVSDCSVYWKLLVSVCPVCVLLSSVVSSTCVYCICRNRAEAARRENKKTRNHNEVGDDDVCYAALDIPSSKQRRLKKRKAESSDLCTYSEVKVPQSLVTSGL